MNKEDRNFIWIVRMDHVHAGCEMWIIRSDKRFEGALGYSPGVRKQYRQSGRVVRCYRIRPIGGSNHDRVKRIIDFEQGYLPGTRLFDGRYSKGNAACRIV